MTESLIQDARIDKGCPVCNAPPGSFCTTPSGKPRSDHKGREYEERKT